MRDLDPDLVLINGEMHEHIIAAAGTGRPIALLNTFVSIWRRPGLPPPHHLVRPGVGWRGSRLGISLLWRELRLRKRLRACSQRIRRLGCDRLSILRRLAREVGFDFRRETDAGQWLIPFTYRRLPVLSLHALEFEFPHRPPSRVHYVGPMVLESRVDRPLPAADRAGSRRSWRAAVATAARHADLRRLRIGASRPSSTLLRRLVEVVPSVPTGTWCSV